MASTQLGADRQQRYYGVHDTEQYILNLSIQTVAFHQAEHCSPIGENAALQCRNNRSD